MKRMLILCTGNSCRSQVAEALWCQIAKGTWESFSAGSRPSGYVHPKAIEAMRELGVDISAYRSKSINEFDGQPFDLVVTVCDNAREACPFVPGAKETLHWPFFDPAEAEGGQEEQIEVFHRVRDEISAAISSYLRG